MNKKPTIISLLGAPCSGKTALTSYLHYNLNRYNCKTLTLDENIRAYVISNKLSSDISLDMINLEMDIVNNNPEIDIFIKDGSPLSYWVYSNDQKIYDKTLESIEKFNFIHIFLPIQKNAASYENWGRRHTFEESIKKEKELLNAVAKKYPIYIIKELFDLEYEHCTSISINDLLKPYTATIGSYFCETDQGNKIESIYKIVSDIYRKIDSTQISCPLIPDKLKFLEQDPYSIEVLIIGQDPYPGYMKATGTPFSSEFSTRSSTSIAKKILPSTETTIIDFSNLNDKRVGLLNCSLTTKIDKPWSDFKIWYPYTKAIIQMINKLSNIKCVVFFGSKQAVYMLSDKFEKINKPYIIFPHPSPNGTDDFDHWALFDVFTIINKKSGLNIDWTKAIKSVD